MPYWIHRNGENVGPYEQAQLQEMLAAGQVTPEELAIEEGASNWSTVGELAGASAPATAAEPVMAEFVSAVPEEEVVPATVASGGGRMKLALVAGVALLVVAGAAFAFFKFSGDEEKPEGHAKLNKPSPGKNTPTPGGNRPPGPLPNPPSPGTNTNTIPGTSPTNAPPVVPPPTPPTPGGAAAASSYIPASVLGVASMNLGQLLQKAGGYDALLAKGLEAAGPEAQEPMVRLIASMLSPNNLAQNFGLTINRPIFAFVDNQRHVGVLVSVSDAAKLEQGLQNLAVALKAPVPELTDLGGLRGISLPGVAAGLTSDALIVVMSTTEPMDMTSKLKAVAAKGAALSVAKPEFKALGESDHDGTLWIDFKDLLKTMNAQITPLVAEKFYGDPNQFGNKLDISVGLSFQQGQVVADLNFHHDPALLANWSTGANLDADIVGSIPGGAAGVLTQSMKMEVIRPFIAARIPAEAKAELEPVLAAFGLSFDQLLNLPGGDLAFSFLGVKQDPRGFPTPEFLFSMNVNDPELVEGFLEKLQASPGYNEMQENGFDIVLNDDVLHIGPSRLKSALAEGNNPNPLPPAAQSLLGANDSALHLSPAAIAGILTAQGEGEAAEFLTQVRAMNLTGNAGEGAQKFRLTLALANQNTNVLQTLVQQAFEAAGNSGEGFREVPVPLPFPPAPQPQPFPIESKTKETKGPFPPIDPRPFPPPPLPEDKGAIPAPTLPPAPAPAPPVPEVNPFNNPK